MASSHRTRYRNPNWSLHVQTTFNPAGIALLTRIYIFIKESSGLDRAQKLSADDIASSVEGLLRVLGINTFFRKPAASNPVRRPAA